MAEITDPAEEFVSVCTALSRQSTVAGANWLAENFETEPWSRDFYQVLFAIVERGYYLIDLVNSIEGAEHIAPQIERNVHGILDAFKPQGLGAAWHQSGKLKLTQENIGPIQVLSALVRPKVSYPKLSEDERVEIVALVDELLGWLDDHQISEQDFIRQALIDGLLQFRFRLERVRWLGYGYAIESLKEVIGAYLALERGFVDDGSMPVVKAMLQKVGEGIKAIYASAGVAKDATDRADFLLKAYGAASMYANANTGGVAGLLTFGGA